MNSLKCLLKRNWILKVRILILCVRLIALSQNRGIELLKILNHLHTYSFSKSATEKIWKFILLFKKALMGIWWTLVIWKKKICFGHDWMLLLLFWNHQLRTELTCRARMTLKEEVIKIFSVTAPHTGGENTPLRLIVAWTWSLITAGGEWGGVPLWSSQRIPPRKLKF